MSRTPPARLVPPLVEPLHRRVLFAAVQPTALEQLMVELINRARANPAAEAARYGIDLNEGLPAGTISTAAKAPLAPNLFLTDAARRHAQWIVDNDLFQHEGEGDSSPQQRMAEAGYAFSGSWAAGENLAIRGPVYVSTQASAVELLHRALFRDDNYPNRAHRTGMLSTSFREIGSGAALGDFAFTSMTLPSQVAATDFARSGTAVFLTGVAYTDAVTDDDFYTVGEGLAGITVTATRASDGAVFTTSTFDAGGYALALPAGSYAVLASGAGLGGTVRYASVTIGSENVKRDFRPDLAEPAASLSGGRLTVNGTPSADTITVALSGGNYTVTVNGRAQSFNAASVNAIDVLCGDGNDILDATAAPVPVYALGGAGADTLSTGSASDTLTGGGGNDSLSGNAGDDRLGGLTGHDTLSGGDGADRLYGDDGNDRLSGGGGTDRLWAGVGDDDLDGGSSNDRLFGEAGTDTLRGGRHNDYLDGGALADVLFGDDGTDSAVNDLLDTRSGVETLV